MNDEDACMHEIHDRPPYIHIDESRSLTSTPTPPSPPIPTHPRRHRASRVRSAPSHRSMVAYVMDDERVIKSAWTPEVRTALDDGEANVFLSLSSSSSRPRIRVVGDDARARILGRGAPRKSLRNSLAVTSSRRPRARARAGARARGTGRDANDDIHVDVSTRARGTTRDRRRRETTTGDDDGPRGGGRATADDKIEDGRRTTAERGVVGVDWSMIVYRGGSICRVASGWFFFVVSV